MGLSFTNCLKKNRTAGLSQSNARKNNRQCKLANQCKVPVTTRRKMSWWLRQFVGEHFWLLVAVNVVSFCCCFVLSSCLGHLKGKCAEDQTEESLD